MRRAIVILLAAALLAVLFIPAHAFEIDDKYGVIWISESDDSLTIYSFYRGECKLYHFSENYAGRNEVGTFSVTKDPDNENRFVLSEIASDCPLVIFLTFNDDGTMTDTWDYGTFTQKKFIKTYG
jgi:hypothetical protein